MNDAPATESERNPVDVLAEEFAEQCRRGEHPTVSDFVRRYPEQADELRQVLPPIALMEKLKHRNLSGASEIQSLKLERLGDFQILREIGRGGMGVVFQAEQESLGRHVALKVLSRVSLLDPQRVKRFEQEAKAAAGLHHTNIVPVFGVGQDEGLHYIVMQMIHGSALNDVIASLSDKEHPAAPGSASKPSASSAAPPSSQSSQFTPPGGRKYWNWVADVGRQVADALSYAHKQRILHRDVKPANLLLDERGNVWITDFGLAKLGAHSDVTHSGDVIGTLQYLAPEGLHSQSDIRGDVYGLGLTLYEMLTLKPAFCEPTPAALMKRIEQGEPLRPRKFNPRIPRDLETIVLKAIARDPASRYQTAADLADDLDNFVHDRMIAARRAHLGQRFWRWCRRNRLVASLGAVATASAIAAIIIGWVAYGISRRALSQEANRRVQADLARQRADANVDLSLQGFEKIFNQLAPADAMPPPLPGPPGQAPQQNARRGESDNAILLKNILNFYDQFAAQNATNPQLEAQAARAYRRVGDSWLHLGKADDANAAYRHSADIYSHLVANSPGDASLKSGFAEATVRLGVRDRKVSPADMQLIHRAAGLIEPLSSRRSASDETLELASEVLLRDGLCLRQSGNLADAEKRFRQSMELWKRSAPLPNPDEPPPRRRQMQGFAAPLALADLLVATNRKAEAKVAIRQAFVELEHDTAGPPRREIAVDDARQEIARVAAAAGEQDIAARARTYNPSRRFDGPRPFPPDFDGPPPPDGPPDRS